MPHHVAADTAVLDGEIAVLDAKGVSQFHLIQPRIAKTDPNSIAHLARSHAGDVFRLRPAVSERLRSAQVDLAERKRAAGRGADAGPDAAASPRPFRTRASSCWRPRGRTGWKASWPSMRGAATSRAAAATG